MLDPPCVYPIGLLTLYVKKCLFAEEKLFSLVSHFVSKNVIYTLNHYWFSLFCLSKNNKQHTSVQLPPDTKYCLPNHADRTEVLWLHFPITYTALDMLHVRQNILFVSPCLSSCSSNAPCYFPTVPWSVSRLAAYWWERANVSKFEEVFHHRFARNLSAPRDVFFSVA